MVDLNSVVGNLLRDRTVRLRPRSAFHCTLSLPSCVGYSKGLVGFNRGYIRTTAAMIWGLMLFGYCLSHAYFLVTLPVSTEPWVGKVGWFLFFSSFDGDQ